MYRMQVTCSEVVVCLPVCTDFHCVPCASAVMQVLRGGHPNWLAADQEEVEARRRHAVEDRLQDLDRELNEIGEDAQRRRNHPQRLEYERQIQQNTNRINDEVARFETLSQRLHSSSINEQWLQEMELIHQLGVKSPRFDVAVGCARERLEKWKEQRRGATPGESDVPEHNFHKPFFSSDGELDQADLRLIRISESPAPLELSSAEREELQSRLKQVQHEMSEARTKHEEHMEMALRSLRVTDDETDEELPLQEFHPEEQVCWWRRQGEGCWCQEGGAGGRRKGVCWWKERGRRGVLVGGGRGRGVLVGRGRGHVGGTREGTEGREC